MGWFSNIFKKVNPIAGGLFGGSDTPNYGKEAARAEAARKAAITQGTTNVNNAFSGFTPTFYNNRAQDYVNVALPQLQQQYQGTRAALIQNLANRGLLKSSSATRQGSALERSTVGAQQTIAEQGRAQAMTLQQQIEARRQDLLGQLNQSADPAGARQGAVSSAAGFSQPSVFGPIANMFAGLLNQYTTNRLINSYNTTPLTSTPTNFAINPDALGGSAPTISSQRY